jgi:hypothetical protein
VVLALSLVSRFATTSPSSRSVDPASGIGAVLGARLSGPISHQGWGSPENASWVITAPVAGCHDPLTIVMVVPPGFESAAALAAFEKPGDRHYFAYLDWISSQPDRWRLLAMRIWQRANEMLGVAPYTSPRVMLYIIEGADCHIVETSNWRKYWLAVR